MRRFYSYIKFGLLGGVLTDIIYSLVLYFVYPPKAISDIFDKLLFFSIALWWIVGIGSPFITTVIFILVKKKGWKNEKRMLIPNVLISIPFACVALVALLFFAGNLLVILY